MRRAQLSLALGLPYFFCFFLGAGGAKKPIPMASLIIFSLSSFFLSLDMSSASTGSNMKWFGSAWSSTKQESRSALTQLR